MNKPVILSLGAMVCAILVFAVPSYNNIQRATVTAGNAEHNDMVSGKRWQCVTQTGPDAPNLVILRENGRFLKLIDYSEVVDNGTNYDLQGMFDIKKDQLLARVSNPSGEIYTDVYTLEPVDNEKMQMTRPGDTDSENTRYNCSMQASHS